MFEIPRCEHGNIILGCPHDDCEAQSIYLWEQDFAMDAWNDSLNPWRR